MRRNVAGGALIIALCITVANGAAQLGTRSLGNGSVQGAFVEERSPKLDCSYVLPLL